MTYDSIAILIPAYKPDERLVTLVKALRAKGFSRVVTVDDGGGEAFRPIFDQLQGLCTVLVHPQNRGKGAALKTGLSYLMTTDAQGVVTADADGQHTPEDCARIAEALLRDPEALILGSRSKKQMPPRSKFGNTCTCVAFFLSTFHWIHDTQTGLRGIPRSRMEACAHLEGDRYEYELNMLLYACHEKMTVTEVEIKTIYIDDNASSHFHPIRDGARIYGLLFRQGIKYAASSLIAFLVDWVCFALLSWAGLAIGAAQLCARVVSSLVNYFINREVVFQGDRRPVTIVKYYILAVFVFLGTWGLTEGLVRIGVTKLVAQPIASLIMFFASYPLQKKFVFPPRKKG